MAEVIKSFTNTDAEDFNGMFHGENYTVLAGESKMFTEKLAKHLAGQLAYKILVRKGGIDPIEMEALIPTFVGNVAVPAEPVVAEKAIKVKAEKPEEEFVDIKPKKKAKKK